MLRIFTALSFSITVFFVVVLIGVQRAEVTRHNRYVAESSAEWNVIQLMSQLERFSSFLEYFMRTGDTKDLNFHQRYEILWSRVLMLVDNPENAGVAAVKSFEASARRADERFAALEPVILAFHPRDEEGYKKIGALLQELRQQLVTLQTDVHKERVAANAQLSNGYAIQENPLLLFTLVVVSTGFLIFELVRSIRRTGVLLKEASAARIEAQAAQERLHTVVDAVPAMIAAWDGRGLCLFANRLHASFHGVSAEQMAGRTAGELGLRPDLGEAVATVLRSSHPVPFVEHVATDSLGHERVLLSTQNMLGLRWPELAFHGKHLEVYRSTAPSEVSSWGCSRAAASLSRLV